MTGRFLLRGEALYAVPQPLYSLIKRLTRLQAKGTRLALGLRPPKPHANLMGFRQELALCA